MAKAPLTLLTMNQPNEAVSPFSAAGRMLPRNPNGPRLTIIIGTPNLGPHEESTAWLSEPRPVPRRMAVAACPRFRPFKAPGMTPVKVGGTPRLGRSEAQ